jgi:hypothetical protein
MTHKLLHGRFESAVSPDGHSVEIKAWGGTLADGIEGDSGLKNRHVFLQPKLDMPENNMMTYKKYMVECAVNLLQEMCESMPPNLIYSKGVQEQKGLTEHRIHEDQLAQLRALSSILTHMINSDSWASGTSEGYDIRAIQKKLKVLIPYQETEV